MNNEHTVAPKTTLQSLKEEARKEFDRYQNDTDWQEMNGPDLVDIDPKRWLDHCIEKAFTAGKEEATEYMRSCFPNAKPGDTETVLSLTAETWNRWLESARTNKSLD